MSVFNFNDEVRLKEWEKDRKRREKISKEYEQKGVPSRERISVQYENPKFVKKKGSQDGGKYNWDRNMLQDLPSKSYGRSYNKKFNKLADEAGIPRSERFAFRKWLDAQEDGEKTTLDTANARAKKDMEQLRYSQEKADKAVAKVKAATEKKKKQYKNQTQGLGAGVQGGARDMGTKESRFAAQGLNALTADLPKQDLIKKMKANPNDKNLQKKYDKMYGGEGKASDIVAQLLGYGAGGLLGGAAVRGTALGAKGVGTALSKGLTKESAKHIAKQTAKEGAVVGGLMAGAEVGSREALNPEDYDWKQNAAKIGLEVGAGAALDPLMTLAKPAFKGASQSAVDKMLNKQMSESIESAGKTVKPKDYDVLKEIVKKGNTSNIPSTPDFSDIPRARADISPEAQMAGDMVSRPRNPEMSSIEPAFRDRANLNVNPRDLGSINRQMSPEELASRSMVERNYAGERPPAQLGMEGFQNRGEVDQTMGLPEPETFYKTRQQLGGNVDVPEGLALNAPKDTTPLAQKVEYWRNPSNPIGDTEIRDIYKTIQDTEAEIAQWRNPNNPKLWKLLDEHAAADPEFSLKQTELENRKDELKKVFERQEDWNNTKLAQQEFLAKNRPEEMKFIVPKDAQLDYEGVPKRFRGSKNTAAMDIYEASTRAGYESVDEYIRYLQGVDKLLSRKRSDFNLASGKYVSAAVKNEQKLSDEIQSVVDGLTGKAEKEALIEELSGMMSPREGANPLQFKKQLPLRPSYQTVNNGLDYKDRVATRIERIEPEPVPYEAKRSKLKVFNEKVRFTDTVKKITHTEASDEVAATIASVVPEGKLTPSQVMDAIEKDPKAMRSFYQKSNGDEVYQDTIINTLSGHPFKKYVNKLTQSIARQGQPLKVYESSVVKDYLSHAQEQAAKATDPADKLHWSHEVIRAEEMAQSVKKDGGRLLMDFENEKATGEIVKTLLAKPTQQLAELSQVSKVKVLDMFKVQTAKRLKWLHESDRNFTATPEQLQLADEILANADPIHDQVQKVFRDMQMSYLDILERTEYIDATRRQVLEEDTFYIPFSRDKSWQNKGKKNLEKPLDPKKKKVEDYSPDGRSRDVSFEGLKELEGGSQRDYFKNPMEAWVEVYVSDVGSAMRNRTHNRLLDLAEMEEAMGTSNYATRISREEFELGLQRSNEDSPFYYATAVRDGEKHYIQVQEDMLKTLQQNDMFEAENIATKITGLVSSAKVTSPSYLMTAIPRDIRQAWQTSEATGLGTDFWKSMWKVATDEALRDELMREGLTFSRGNNPYSSSRGGLNVETVQREIDADLLLDVKKDYKTAIKRLNERYNVAYTGLRKIGKISDDLPRMAEANLVKQRWSGEGGKIPELEAKIAQMEEAMQGQNLDNFEGSNESIMELNLAKQHLKDAKRNMHTEMLHRGRDVMNYTQQGSNKAAKGIKKYLMFANTATVSKHKMARSMVRDPVGFFMKYGAISAPITALSATAYHQWLNDEEREQYDAIPDYIKTQKYIIPLGNKEYIMLPRVHELAIIENYVEVLSGQQGSAGANRTALKEALPFQSGNVLQAAVPDEQTGYITTENAVLPSTGVSPFLDILLNKKTTFNQKEVSYDKDNPDTYTTDVSKKLFGGMERVPNAPDVADYLIKQLGGDYGRTGLAMADLANESDSKEKLNALTRVLNPAQDYRNTPNSAWWREMFLDSEKVKAQRERN